jgi:hypothetical protein
VKISHNSTILVPAISYWHSTLHPAHHLFLFYHIISGLVITLKVFSACRSIWEVISWNSSAGLKTSICTCNTIFHSFWLILRVAGCENYVKISHNSTILVPAISYWHSTLHPAHHLLLFHLIISSLVITLQVFSACRSIWEVIWRHSSAWLKTSICTCNTIFHCFWLILRVAGCENYVKNFT